MTKQITKRNGLPVDFDREKIIVAIGKANRCVTESERLSDEEITSIASSIEEECLKMEKVGVEDIQDMVEIAIMKSGKYRLAKEYITFRDRRALQRRKNTTDDSVLSLLKRSNAEIMAENANKNPVILSTQRDYMAGEVSKDISKRYLIPDDIVKAHEKGVIHFHDMDYFAMNMYNCCLINLDDMLQNGTVISKTMIEKPHTFHNACNIASQIVAQVASSQYGGQTITATHLAKFVEPTRQYLRKIFSEHLFSTTEFVNKPEIEKMYEDFGEDNIYPLNKHFVLDNDFKYVVKMHKFDSGVIQVEFSEIPFERFEKLIKAETLRNIRDGVQTLQYQILTLMTTNGQTPFVSVALYLNEAKTPELKADLALVIEEILRQRIKGVKNEKGQWYANPFPKLLYHLEEDNIRGGKYFYLTQLAVKCTAMRMVPDYISEKIMLENKIDKNGEGHCYPPMGCRSFLTPYVDEDNVPKYYGRFNQGRLAA